MLAVIIIIILALNHSGLEPGITGYAILKTITQTDFDEGTYAQTFYNDSEDTENYVQLNATNKTGNYTSKVFDAGSTVKWNNISWHEQRLTCPEGMAYINKLNGFCIDLYEASTPGCELVGENCGDSAQTNYCTKCTPDSGVFGNNNLDTGTTVVA